MKPALLAALALLLLAAPAHAARRPSCDVRPGATVVADGTHRVYATVVQSRRDQDNSRLTVHSCASGSRKPSKVLLRNRNTIDGYLSPSSGRLAGRWLLMDVYEETGVSAGHALKLYDLERGEQQASVYADTSDGYDYALTKTGAFAAALSGPRTLNSFDATGRHTLAGKGVKDVAAAGAQVYWSVAGVPASATLGGPPKGTIDFWS